MNISRVNRAALLLSTMLLTPSLAMGQEAPPAPEEVVTTAQDDGEVVVLGRFIPEPMRQTSEVASFLSSEDLARQGDDNAALALTRLTGLSVANGRFVYVRGLGDRYSSALLNGSPLPSPEPLRRQVPLDLFPSNILDGATVQKTFSPNYPGEFGGGVIDLRTLRMPAEPFLTVKVGSALNTETTLQDGVFYYGEDNDWTGFAGSRRDIPGPLAAAIGRGLRISDTNFTAAELETIGESFVNSPFTVLQRGERAPDFEGEISAGASWDAGRFNFGALGVFGYDTQWRNREAERVNVVGDAIASDFEAFTTMQDTVLNAFGSLSMGWNENSIALTGLVTRSTTKQAQIAEGINTNDASNLTRHSESSGWYERQLASLQLAGDHQVGPLELSWRGAFAQSTRDAPYERSITYFIQDGGPPEYSRDNQNITRFSYVTDEVASGGADAAYTIPLSDQRDAVISAGVSYSNTVRWYELYSFVFTGPALPAPSDVLRARVDYLFSPDNIDPLRFEIAEFTGRDDSYKGRLTINAAYVAADVELMPLLRAAVGVRYEDATEVVRTSNRFGETPFAAPILLENTYWLPAATVTWNFAEDLQLRLGYSQTIARPQFRELAFTPYLDPETDRVYGGNPSLTDSEFENWDARLEYYFGRNQFVTVGAFYKDVLNPIEEVIVPGQEGTSTFTRFINAPRAELYGAEIEYRTSFEINHNLPIFRGGSWIFSANYTYTHSEVSADAGDMIVNPTTLPQLTLVPASQFGLDGTELQGTPEHIANLQFGWETDETQLTLLAGWVSERIARRGLGSLPAVIEDPGVNVDLVYRQNFTLAGTDLQLSLAGRNLLGERHEEFQNSALGRTELNSYDRGTTLSASLTAKF